MAMRIKHNIASLNSLRHANNNFENVKSAIARLSSGSRISKGADGPSSLIASERLRGTIVGLQQAYSNATVSVSLLQTAEGALSEVSNILIRLKQLSVHAANEAVNDPEMLRADQMEMEHLLSSLDRIAQNTMFGGKKLLDGSQGANGVTVGDHLRFVAARPDTKESPEDGYEVNITQVATRTQKQGDIAITVDNLDEGLFIVLTENGKNATLDTRTGDLSEEIGRIRQNVKENPGRFSPEQASKDIRSMIITRLQRSINESGLELRVIESPENQALLVEHKQFGDSTSFSVTSSVAGILSTEANVAEFAKVGKNVEGNLGGEVALGKGQKLTALDGTRAAGLTIEYNGELDWKEEPILDERGVQTGTKMVRKSNEELVGGESEGYVHLSQQSKEYQLGPNPGQSSAISLANVRSNMLSQGMTNESGFQSLADIDVTDLQGSQDANLIIDKAIDEVSTMRADLGAFQKNAVESNLNSLKIAEENLTQAESSIRDADIAEEMSRLTSDQILLSASTAMIAQANQVPKTVLGLLSNGG